MSHPFYSEQQIREIGEQAKGKTIESFAYVDDEAGGYWALTFTDGSEMCVRLMVEVEMERRAGKFMRSRPPGQPEKQPGSPRSPSGA